MKPLETNEEPKKKQNLDIRHISCMFDIMSINNWRGKSKTKTKTETCCAWESIKHKINNKY